jgi:membrane fusion protein, multidrug efflux system
MNDQDSTAPSASNGKRRKILLLISGTVSVILFFVFVWWFFIGQWRIGTDDAYVNGNIVAVVPQTGGTVIGIYADTTQAVTEGQLLVQIDDSDARLQLDTAEAALASAVREVRGMYATNQGNLPLLAQRRADLARTQAELTSSDAVLEQAESEYNRRVELSKQNFVSPENVQSALSALDAAQAKHDAAANAVIAAIAAISQTRDQAKVSSARVDNTSLENHPAVRTAAVKVREAALALARTRVLSPVSGQVAQRAVQIGGRVSTGTAMMAIVPLDKVWLDANFKETELRDVRIDQPVKLVSDFYGNSFVFHGKVLGLVPGTGSSFSLLPAQNATGNWVKIVQRLPVRIALDPAELRSHPLRIGLSMDVTIDTHDRSGAELSTLPEAKAISATNVYAQNIKAADARVAQIIADNLARK